MVDKIPPATQGFESRVRMNPVVHNHHRIIHHNLLSEITTYLGKSRFTSSGSHIPNQIRLRKDHSHPAILQRLPKLQPRSETFWKIHRLPSTRKEIFWDEMDLHKQLAERKAVFRIFHQRPQYIVFRTLDIHFNKIHKRVPILLHQALDCLVRRISREVYRFPKPDLLEMRPSLVCIGQICDFWTPGGDGEVVAPDLTGGALEKLCFKGGFTAHAERIYDAGIALVASFVG